MRDNNSVIWEFTAKSEDDTRKFGQLIAPCFQPGDFISLEGNLGAGKTFLARSIVRSLTNDPELDVPSPTFALVQPYEGPNLQIIHADLYRLDSSSDIYELDLGDGEDAITLIEWFVNAEDDLPAPNWIIRLEQEDLKAEDPDGTNHFQSIEQSYRKISVSSSNPNQHHAVKSARATFEFLERSGWSNYDIQPIKGDASFRAFDRVTGKDDAAILMHMDTSTLSADYKAYMIEAGLARTSHAFVAVSQKLQSCGFSSPQILNADFKLGKLLVEDLGSDGLLDVDGAPIKDRYKLAVRALARLHQHDIDRTISIHDNNHIHEDHIHELPILDQAILGREVMLCPEWFAPDQLGAELDQTALKEYRSLWASLFSNLRDDPSLVLRDVHSPNLLWLEDRAGLKKIGFIDIQDALYGPKAYDLASLIQDARVTILPDDQAELFQCYCDEYGFSSSFDKDAFRYDFEILAAQRCTKLLGLFIRLEKRDGKTNYRVHLPRSMAYLKQNLESENLRSLDIWFQRYLPDVLT